MPHISGHDRSQTLLLPESLDDYVGLENPVRFIDAFVDGLDLAAAGFARVAPNSTGRPGYAPEDLLKLYIYGYLNRVRSSRRLEAEKVRAEFSLTALAYNLRRVLNIVGFADLRWPRWRPKHRMERVFSPPDGRIPQGAVPERHFLQKQRKGIWGPRRAILATNTAGATAPLRFHTVCLNYDGHESIRLLIECYFGTRSALRRSD
jgi:hypothetical protein